MISSVSAYYNLLYIEIVYFCHDMLLIKSKYFISHTTLYGTPCYIAMPTLMLQCCVHLMLQYYTHLDVTVLCAPDVTVLCAP